MRLTKEIKLENPKRCNGCPMCEIIQKLGQANCKENYYLELRYNRELTKYFIKRPYQCILENGL